MGGAGEYSLITNIERTPTKLLSLKIGGSDLENLIVEYFFVFDITGYLLYFMVVSNISSPKNEASETF